MLKIILDILKQLLSNKDVVAKAVIPSLEIVKDIQESPKKEEAALQEQSPLKIVKPWKMYIGPQDIITSSGRYPERAKSSELTTQVLSNIDRLCNAVNNLLNEIQWQGEISISSGFRTSASNAATAGAAKKSSHMLGLAIDIVQPLKDNTLGKKIRQAQNNQGKKGILGRYGLMMESIEVTVGQNTSWVHLDLIPRSERPSMEFKP